ncbi:two-component system sensor histidine kinase DesK [Blastococcus xanthinilyticus]|uniref:Two-component system sensor histidine kinase DesK n=1 Tax=Blastococcus xanthinilyticus TaxID=1564164 RepID=A0A5S5D0Z3_9ACTN|nr:histidine kinase [Blastococcus xanthinilyticus]TYP89014.1 two-component system sensor histidine kinase DesK [Blastococcus xanthinilyticus]
MDRSPRPALPEPTTAGSAAATQVSRRRFRTLNLALFLPLLATVGALLVARQAQSWGQAAVLGLGIVAALVAFERWTAGDVARVAVPCLAVAAGTWPFGLLVVDSRNQGAFYAIAVVGSLVVSQLPRHRGPAASGLVVYVAAVGLIGLLTQSPADADGVIEYVILPTGFTAIVTGLMFPNKRFYDVVADLEEARERDAELAVMRERMRFAGDLHDIQGHTLHVVKLKIALARKLIHSDPERAEQELGEMYALVGDTIAQTRELAYGQRRLNLAAELENAKNLLEAAGAQVRVDSEGDAGAPADDLLAQVLRETTTNILRHSRATLVHIAICEHSISVVNDGAIDDVLPELRGLATLGHRVSDEGGELTVQLEGGRFRTAATFPAPTSAAQPATAGEARR